ncbi:hypothetical protein SAMN05428988_3148 [Chitinophaga sp. YR573]|uniref:hypothetical protein n=1 Tax=Chitinophaga sp. YR573 TaxID=1881040 RepID=UPI0008BB7F86|nr:hypothetical protein [Chitinophaga sp. YR573]SEW20915.1 hypothetical protein SAMN05428988_3148 [Chitinophaga sp. YR573]
MPPLFSKAEEPTNLIYIRSIYLRNLGYSMYTIVELNESLLNIIRKEKLRVELFFRDAPYLKCLCYNVAPVGCFRYNKSIKYIEESASIGDIQQEDWFFIKMDEEILERHKRISEAFFQYQMEFLPDKTFRFTASTKAYSNLITTVNVSANDLLNKCSDNKISYLN